MAAAWGAPGIGTAIQAAASIRRVKPTDTRSRRSYCTNGIGRSIFPANPRTNVTSIMSPTSSTCALTSSSIPASPRRSTTRRSIAGKSASTIANGRGHNFSSQRWASCPDYTPPFEGIESFKGISYHTSKWPKEQADFSGKRVAVIGTGATAVQLIPIIAKEVGHLTVFQRTPNYCAPLRNGLVDPETQRRFKATYPEIHKRIRETPAGFTHDFDPRNALKVPREERLALYEELWAQPGFKKWLGNFHDIMTSREANEDFAEFVRDKIRARIKDPVVAEKLVPKDHPFGSKRIPLETNYYEAYNRDNVLLVDVRETPIERITPKGIKTSDAEYEFDVIIYATGFDAVSGALTRMDIRGEGGQTFKDRWADGPRTYLGLQTAGFPNFFIAVNTAFCNYPVCAEFVCEWIADCIRYMREKGFASIAPTPQAEEAWIAHANELASRTLLSDAKSWFMGSNIPGKKRALLLYANTAPAYRAKCTEVATKGYEGFDLE